MLSTARLTAVFALMISIGLHTAVIQSTAWMSMLVQYTEETGSVAQAVADTFDGAHACPLCQLAREMDSVPSPVKQSTDPSGTGVKLHLIAEATSPIIIQTLPPQASPSPTEPVSYRLPCTPDTPPPRRNRA